MRVAELWRYPVKSMAGEPLQTIEIREDGLVGDRLVHVADARGRTLTARTVPGLLGLRATWDAERGEPLVDGRPWDSPEAARAVQRVAGAGARLVRYEGPERFDVLPLLVATDGAVAALGVDRRRLRPSIVVGGVDGLAERAWPGHRLSVGKAVLVLEQLRPRCVMTTFDPDTLEQDHRVLRRIVKEFGGAMALDCSVLRGGRVSVGDPVELEPAEPA
jgi:MOSC domain-containing protein